MKRANEMAFWATVETMALFFILLAIGFLTAKIGIIKKEGMGQLSQLITKVFLPTLIFSMTTTSVTLDLVRDNAILLPLSMGVYATLAAVALAIAKILRVEHDRDRVFQFAFIFGNTGFVGFPLLTAVFHETGTLFMCMFSVVDQVLFWTYGIWLSTARGRQGAGFNVKMFASPNIIAIILALIVALSGLTLPDLVSSALSTVSRATTPMCMLFLGAMICFNKVGQTLKRPDSYALIVVKMVALPIMASLCASALGLSADIIGCMVLYIALPVMTVVPMVSAQNGSEGPYATGLAVMTFVACVITIPVVAFVAL